MNEPRKVIDLGKMSLADKRFDTRRLAEVLEKAILAGGREPSDRAKKSFAPSGLGYGSGKCPRQWYYAFTGGVLREESADSVGISNMDYGTDAHERIQKVFESSGILVEQEREINTIGSNEYPPIRGYADLVINWQGEEVVGEIKTTSQESYVSKKSKSAPAGYHLLQVLIYMKIMGLNKGFLLYENKNTQQWFILPVTWNATNRELVDNALGWMQQVYDNWQAGSKPKRPYRSERSVECKSCPFVTHCWADEDEGEVAIAPLVVPK